MYPNDFNAKFPVLIQKRWDCSVRLVCTDK